MEALLFWKYPPSESSCDPWEHKRERSHCSLQPSATHVAKMSGEPPSFHAIPSLPVGGATEFTGYTDVVFIPQTDPYIIYTSYKAFSISRHQHVFIKTCGTKIEDVTKLRHEWKVFQSLPDDMPGIIKPLALETSSRGLGLVFPWMPEIRSLNSIYLTTSPGDLGIPPPIPLDLKTFLNIAAQMAKILTHLHAAKVIHKNIGPDKLLLNPKGEVYIHDFMIASCLEREETAILAKTYNPKILEGTLAYLAPENTGRMNRSIDKRCDFYALGCTFYELLAGRLPFLATDPLELMHQHIAQAVIPPHELKPSIPRAVSEMILKLMAKTPEERYQSAEGLKADLDAIQARCYHAAGEGDVPRVLEGFVVGEMDNNSQFVLPQKLFGREAEVKKLMDAFESVRSRGCAEIVVIKGYSGVGKTSLVNEIQRPVVASKGYFTHSKFDLFQRDIPFVSLIQAFRELIRQLLTESSEQLTTWRENIQDAVGADGKVIADVIPEVEKIIGPQPPIPQLGPSETEGRFTRVFRKFIGAFGQKDHPLVLFLDDLQWSSQTELLMIKKILYNPDPQHLLVIGAYRSNEVHPHHMLAMILNEIITEKHTNVGVIDLEPLKEECVKLIVCATLHCENVDSPEIEMDVDENDGGGTDRSVHKLSRMIFDKTDGNPFFVLQLLKSLYQEQLLVFSFDTGSWDWDMNTLYLKEISPNVVDLLVDQLQKLTPRAQHIVSLASCIGNRFTSDVLSIVNEKDLVSTMEELWDALRQQFIVPIDSKYKVPMAYTEDPHRVLKREVWNAVVAATAGTAAAQGMPKEPASFRGHSFTDHMLSRHIVFFIDPETNTHQISQEPIIVTFRFLHDRVQQAAYTLIPEEERQATHLKIGRLLLNFVDEEDGKRREAIERDNEEKSRSNSQLEKKEGPFLEKNLFDIVNQLNAGLDLLMKSYPLEDRERLAQLNLKAGIKAKESTAFETAIKYLQTGMKLLNEDCWERQYDVAISIYIELADAEYATTLFKDAREHFQFALEKCQNDIDRGKIYNRLLKCHTGEGNPNQAVNCGLEGLRQLGYPIPDKENEINQYCADLGKELVSVENVKICEFAHLPPLTDPKQSEVIRILVNLIPPLYFAQPALLPPIIITSVALSIKFGNSPEGSYAYCLYGLLLSGQAADIKNMNRMVKDIETSYEWGRLAITTANSFARNAIKCPVFKVFASHIQHWVEPLSETFDNFKVAIKEGISTHNGEYTGYGCTELCMYLFFSGKSLEAVSQMWESFFGLVTKFKQEIGDYYIKIGYQVVLNLMGKFSKDVLIISGDIFVEERDTPIIFERKYLLHTFCFYMYKTILCVLFRHKDKAMECSKKAMEVIHGAVGTLFVAEMCFWRCLTLLENFSTLDEADRSEIDIRIEQFRNWSVRASSCFQHKLDLVCAMHAKIVLKDFLMAVDLFDKAIAGGKENGYIHEAAFANELAAELFLERKKDRIAADYLYEAYYCYMRWGALAKLNHLMAVYTAVLAKMPFAHTFLEEPPVKQNQSQSYIADSDGNDKGTDIVPGNVVVASSKTSPIAMVAKGMDNPYFARQKHTDAMRIQILPVEDGLPSTALRSPLPRGYGTVTELDLATVMTASLVISEEIFMDNLLEKLMNILLKTAGAERAVLILEKNSCLFVEASAFGSTQFPKILIHRSEPIDSHAASLPIAVVNYVARTRESIVNGLNETLPLLTNDAYILAVNPKSLLCIAISHQGRLTGVLYMENIHVSNAFTQERTNILRLLSSQVAVSIRKARLYKDLADVNERLVKSSEQIEEQNRTLEQKVKVRTEELQVKNERLLQEIAERKKAVVEMAKAKEMAEFATQMKSTFLANMSHEIRTPFNSVLNVGKLLLETELTPIQRDYVETIRTSSDELLHIINDILGKLSTRRTVWGHSMNVSIIRNVVVSALVFSDFTKIEAGKLDLECHPFSLRNCVEGALDVSGPKASDKGLELGFWNKDGDDKLDWMLGDFFRLKQVIINLVSNAVKFTAQGQVIVTAECRLLEGIDDDTIMQDWYRADQEQRTPPAVPFTSPPTHTIHISVSDTGIGIPYDKFDKLFKLFGQVDSATTRHYGGTGLGLNISERLSKLMGGRMWVESELGQGSTFHFTFQTTLMDDPNADKHEFAKRVQSLKLKKCLIIDDNATTCQILKQDFEAWGLTTTTCSKAAEALELLRENHYDIAIVDAVLGDSSQNSGWDGELNGIELVRQMRKLEGKLLESPLHNTEVVLLTPATTQISKKLDDLNVRAIHPKPWRRSRLWSTLYDIFPSTGDRQGNRPPKRPRIVEGATLSTFPVDLVKVTGPLSILIAEDNLVNQKVAIQLLKKMGFNSADVANDGQEAIDAIKQKKYDLVFMDVNMPNMDGLTATRIICETVKNRPRIVAMTANAMRGDKDMCLEAGCDDYIAKPILIDELVNALTDAGFFKRAAEEVSVDDASVPVLEADGETRTSSSSSLPLLPHTADLSATMVTGIKRTNSVSKGDDKMDKSRDDEEQAARPTKAAKRTKE